MVADQHNFIMPLPMTRNGQDGILVIVDRLSKMTHFAPTTSDVDGVTARLFMDYVFKLHGLPERVVTDRGYSVPWSVLCGAGASAGDEAGLIVCVSSSDRRAD